MKLIHIAQKQFHKCTFDKIIERSNVIQYDEMGYPLRLCLCQCKCGKTSQEWLDTTEKSNDVELVWSKTSDKIE